MGNKATRAICIGDGNRRRKSVASVVSENDSVHLDVDEQSIEVDNRHDVRKIYRVTKKELGRGTYGVVRKCIHRKTGEKFAIKTIVKSRITRLEHLQTEIGILKSIDHPNIIKLEQVFDDEKYIHLIMPICTGRELFDHILERIKSSIGKFSEKDAANLARQIFDAIAYCHSHGIVHRDLKPENFVFETYSPESQLKLIDFGLSTSTDCSDTGNFMETRVGTPFYVAPEVLRKKYNNKCDVWSIGVIIYILLSGSPPFHGTTDAEIFQRIKYSEPSFASEDWTTISYEAKDLLKQLLSKNVDERPSAEQALAHPWFRKSTGRRYSHTVINTEYLRERLVQYANMNRFEKAVLNFIAHEIDESEVAHLKQFFNELDEDGNGRISFEELCKALDGFHLSDDENEDPAKEIEMLFTEIDLNGDHEIDYIEFLAAVVDRNVCFRERFLLSAFAHFDRSKSGKICANDLLASTGMDIEEAETIFQAIDSVDGMDLTLDFNSFKKMIKNNQKIAQITGVRY